MSGSARVEAGRGSRPLRTVFTYVAVTALGALMLMPVFIGVLGGFKDTGQLSRNALGLPDPWLTGNYLDIIKTGSFWRQVGNSVFIALGTALVVVSLGALAAFIFARFAFRGREFLVMLFAIGLMFPFVAAILPLFVLLRTFGLLDNPVGVILPQAAFALPVTIIVLRTFFRAVPREVEEAAIIDGCSTLRFFWRIMLPIARPALAMVAVLAIVNSWNNFLLPLVVFQSPEWWTLPVGVQQFKGQYSTDTAKVLAYTVMAILPALAIYAVAERQLIGGLTSGATKG